MVFLLQWSSENWFVFRSIESQTVASTPGSPVTIKVLYVWWSSECFCLLVLPPSPQPLPLPLTRRAAVQVWFMAAVSAVPPPQGRCCGGSLCVWPWRCTYTAAHHSSGPQTDTGDTDGARGGGKKEKKKSDNSATCPNEAAGRWQQEGNFLRDKSQPFEAPEL